jgi:enterochelin esterase-like enzyme
MRIESRLKRIEKQLGIGVNIKRTVLVLSDPLREGESEVEQSAKIDRMVQEAIERDPTNPFILLLVGEETGRN